MSDVIAAAVIAALASVLGSYLANMKQGAVMEEKIRELKEDLTTLSQRVDKYNNLVERMALVEASTKSAHKRIDEMHG
mgnify:FL=1